MKKPRTASNPFMSLWLSGANKVAGAARAQAISAVKREAAKATRSVAAEGAKQAADFWSAAFGLPAAVKAKPARRR